MQKTKSFWASVEDGLRGMVVGALVLGAIGAGVGLIGGAAVGALGLGIASASLFAPLVGSFAFVEGMIPATAGVGAMLGLGSGLSIGSTLGGIAGIVKGREAAAVSGQDVVNVANMAFAQGYTAAKEQGANSPEKAEEVSKLFQQQLEEQRQKAAAVGMAR